MLLYSCTNSVKTAHFVLNCTLKSPEKKERKKERNMMTVEHSWLMLLMIYGFLLLLRTLFTVKRTCWSHRILQVLSRRLTKHENCILKEVSFQFLATIDRKMQFYSCVYTQKYSTTSLFESHQMFILLMFHLILPFWMYLHVVTVH